MSQPSDEAPQPPHRSKACRRLFGPVDSEQLRRDCDALMADCLQEARERWNFDFVTETPLEGNFAWERVRGLGLPKLYLAPGPRGGREDPAGCKRPSTSATLLPAAQEDHVDLSLTCTLVPRSPETAAADQPDRFLPLQTPTRLLQEEAVIRPPEAAGSWKQQGTPPKAPCTSLPSSALQFVCLNYYLCFNLNSSLCTYSGSPYPQPPALELFKKKLGSRVIGARVLGIFII
uniref:Cyclin-dependent kinase inhibitor 1 n=1 Tax=Oryctolagus cuniculus TaxID=9986 RepID=G1TAS0_RABIT